MNRSSGTIIQNNYHKQVIIHLETMRKVRLKHLSCATQEIMVRTDSTLRMNNSLER